ncbi:GNAT family N-acetyltransferase [Undibacterium jejuense]|uniref:GNAT family N-acetyltransferase n=1 Tax=Undibacterium jejuense TaxID=1344949 RepID=A0A923HI43_9BURK|nr:GNAT family N-acetyltransferase [Undibacterium jejuense]MBC3861184.1 GNAT family N-acetyltransferase [Undibacterium jejuense]
MTLRHSIITTETGFDALASDWRTLEAEIPDLLPFQTFDWNRLWWRFFSDTSLFHRDELAICAMYDNEKLVAVMPLCNTHIGFYRFHVYRYVRPFGADPNLTELRLPLALPAYKDSILRFWETMSRQEIVGLAEFQLIHTQAHAEHFLTHNQEIHPLSSRTIPNFVLHLNDDWHTFKAKLKRNIKESLRHCYNSLKRDQLHPELKLIEGSENLKLNITKFFALHTARASADADVSHPDYFAKAQHKDFILALLDSEFSRRCIMFSLELNGEPVAMRLGFKMNDELYLYYSGYDLTYSKYSVMTTLVAETIQWAITQKIQRINLSVGEDVSKTRWGPEVINYVEYHCVRNNFLRRTFGQNIYRLRQWRKNTLLRKLNQA